MTANWLLETGNRELETGNWELRPHAYSRFTSPRRKHVEQGKPVHRVDRCRSLRARPRGSPRSRPSAEGGRVRIRPRLHVGAETGDPHVVDRPRGARSGVAGGPGEV